MTLLRILRSPSAPGWWDPTAKTIEEAIRRFAGRVGYTGTVTGDTLLNAANGSVFVDATAGPVTIALPPAASVSGRIFTVKKIDASGNAVTVDAATELIDGSNTAVITTQYDSIPVQSDGVQYWII